MKDYIQNLLPRIRQYSESLDKIELFIDKPWVILDEDNNQQKYIFRRNGELIMSLNGQATTGKWEYISAAKCLLIDRIKDKILLNQDFVDPAVMVLKMDGNKDMPFVLANENLIPDMDVVRYLNNYLANQALTEKKNIQSQEIARQLKVNYEGTGYTFKMGSYSIFNVKFPNGNQVEIYSRSKDGKYFLYELNDIYLFPNRETCLIYLATQY